MNGNISIKENILNIKYANNGTGKSTIAKAMILVSQGKSLNSLKPFSLKHDKMIQPEVLNLPFVNIMAFNDDYMKQYIFQKNDLIKGTFEVFIKTQEYNELKEAIDSELERIRMVAEDKPKLGEIAGVLESLCQLIVINKDGKTISRKTSGVKSLLDDSKSAIFNPPEELKVFRPFFNDADPDDWVSWKFKGINTFGDKGLCPFCAEKETEEKKQITQLFKNTFDELSISYTNKIRNYLMSISEFLDPNKLNDLLELLNPGSDRSVLEMQLIKLQAEASYLNNRFKTVSSFNGFTINRSNMIEFEQQFRDMVIAENALDFFKTDKFIIEVSDLNNQINNVITMIGKLKAEVAKFSKYLQGRIKSKTDDINEFLKSAGFNYSFNINIQGEDNAQAYLQYIGKDTNFTVDKPDEHLSWGERNAFGLLLFMFDAISKKADLIILDDPISSFDSNKKYAIINRLFKTGTHDSLYQKTVLLFTHDFEPVIDYIQVGGKLSGDSVLAHYLENVNSTLTERPILKNQDMMSTVVLMRELAADSTLNTATRIACMRKYYEHTIKNPKSDSPAYNILSSLIHGREFPTYDNEGKISMSMDDFEIGCDDIRVLFNGFDYDTILFELDDIKLLGLFQYESNAFFRLQILRAYIERDTKARERLKKQDDVFRKFIDEQFHIENDYLYSLDVRKFNIVPQYYSDRAKLFVADEIRDYTQNHIGIRLIRDATSREEFISRIKEVPFYEIPASAGLGSDDFFTPASSNAANVDKIQVISQDCDYAVRISGESMEPEIHDGDILLVKSCEEVHIGDIGIYLYDGCLYCKRLKYVEGKPYLYSDNSKFDPKPIIESLGFKAQGIVLGKKVDMEDILYNGETLS